ncbi:MAG: hypothetical protein LCH73_16490 [Proteobacteria bacterium]|nr:hypothetical protein [Pseudomonadota bacterium]
MQFVLKPDPSLGPEDFPDDTRQLMDASPQTLALDDAFKLQGNVMRVMRIKTGHFTINCHINTFSPGDRLFVMFHGARKSVPGETRPLFMRTNWSSLYPGPVLSLSDPQTEADWGSNHPRAGLYIGTFKNDLVPEINALVNKFCDELGIARDRVVYYGSSAGGGAALLAGGRRPEGCGVIAVCAALRTDNFRPPMIKAASQVAGGTPEDWEAMRRQTPERCQPLTAIEYGVKHNPKSRFVVAQCVEDLPGVNKHFKSLLQTFQIASPQGGMSADHRVLALTYSSEVGHGREPSDLCRPLLKATLDFLDGKFDGEPAQATATTAVAATA